MPTIYPPATRIPVLITCHKCDPWPWFQNSDWSKPFILPRSQGHYYELRKVDIIFKVGVLWRHGEKVMWCCRRRHRGGDGWLARTGCQEIRLRWILNLPSALQMWWYVASCCLTCLLLALLPWQMKKTKQKHLFNCNCQLSSKDYITIGNGTLNVGSCFLTFWHRHCLLKMIYIFHTLHWRGLVQNHL